MTSIVVRLSAIHRFERNSNIFSVIVIDLSILFEVSIVLGLFSGHADPRPIRPQKLNVPGVGAGLGVTAGFRAGSGRGRGRSVQPREVSVISIADHVQNVKDVSIGREL